MVADVKKRLCLNKNGELETDEEVDKESDKEALHGSKRN